MRRQAKKSQIFREDLSQPNIKSLVLPSQILKFLNNDRNELNILSLRKIKKCVSDIPSVKNKPDQAR